MKTIAHTWRHSKKTLNVSLVRVTIGPFIRGKIRRVLNKMPTVCTIYTSMSYLIRRVLLDKTCSYKWYTQFTSYLRRVLAKLRLILGEMCRLYGKFASYLRPVLCKTRLIFPHINGPNNNLKNVIKESKLRLDGLVFKVYLFQVHLKWGLVERGGLIEDILYVTTGNICRRNIERLLCHRNITVLVFL